MRDANDILEPSRTAEIEITIEEVFGLIEVFHFLAPIDQFMIHERGVSIDGSDLLMGKGVAQFEVRLLERRGAERRDPRRVAIQGGRHTPEGPKIALIVFRRRTVTAA